MGDLMEEGEVRDMTPRLLKDLGMRFATEKSNYKVRFGLYECVYCGNSWECNSYNINLGYTKSCGCLSIINNITHGLTHNRFYGRWGSIQARCNNPKSKGYKDYGARGITVCDEWLSATSFVAWCEDTYIEGYTLDRIDNDKGYSPENCRWADKTTQAINQRIQKNNKSGYVGVSWKKDKNIWTIRIKVNTKYVWLGDFDDLMGAVIFRDQYIIENKLPHKLNLKQEQINE